MDKVSIVITTYNRTQWLETAIASCVNQKISLELIVIDDGSKTDAARKIVEKFPGVIYHFQENMGLGGARNAGLNISSGDFIQFLDDDDWLDPLCISKKLIKLSQHPDYGAVYSDLFFTDAIGNTLGRYFSNKKRPLPEGSIFEHLLLNNFIPVHSLLWRKSVINKIGGFPVRSGAEDWEFLVKAAQITKILFLDEPLGYYRLHQSNMSLNYSQQVRGDAVVQSVIVNSDPFKNLPRSTQVKSLITYSRKQWLWGERKLAFQYRELARKIFPLNLHIIMLYLFMSVGQRTGQRIVYLFWKIRGLLSGPSTTNYFLNRIKKQ